MRVGKRPRNRFDRGACHRDIARSRSAAARHSLFFGWIVRREEPRGHNSKTAHLPRELREHSKKNCGAEGEATASQPKKLAALTGNSGGKPLSRAINARFSFSPPVCEHPQTIRKRHDEGGGRCLSRCRLFQGNKPSGRCYAVARRSSGT
ncbi:MAG: hypothetical protein AAF416_22280 [Pseudomonadota bacterium]